MNFQFIPESCGKSFSQGMMVGLVIFIALWWVASLLLTKKPKVEKEEVKKE